jgi:hypothetical protein
MSDPNATPTPTPADPANVSPPPAPAPAGDPPAWDAGLDAPAKEYLAANGYKSVADLTKSAMHLQQMMGAPAAEVFRLPKDPNDAAAWEPIWNALGRPPEATGYSIKPDDKIGLDGPLLEGFLDAMHKAGAPDRFVAAAGAWFAQTQTQQAQDMQAALDGLAEEAKATLTKEWGGAYEQKVAAGNALIREHAGEEFSRFLQETGLATNVHWCRFVDKIAGLVGNPGAIPGEPGRDTRGGAQTPAEAQAALSEFEKNYGDALSDRSHPDHKQRVAQREALIKAAF